MKKFIFIFGLQLFAFGVISQTELMPIVKKIDVKQSKETLLNLDKKLDVYISKYPGKWLPLYWSGFTKLLIAHKSEIITEKDLWVDKAGAMIDKSMPLSDKKSEVAVLKALAVSIKILADPQRRGPRYVGALGYWTKRAKALNPKNPRAHYLEAMRVMATPVNLGGGHIKARPIFERSLSLYKTFSPISSLYPSWGEGQVAEELKKIK
jgi:hypothetical protein